MEKDQEILSEFLTDFSRDRTPLDREAGERTDSKASQNLYKSKTQRKKENL